ncbi:MAG: DUF222 domain-containing protein, partial [Pseudonocardiaceae bacterium]|nr:DUF222 domain-containing protein [Pseudonocardiaceae bacterium]
FWGRGFAGKEYGFALRLVEDLPDVWAALAEGRIDRGKAWVFAHVATDLTPAQRQTICDRLLPKAARLAPGELAARIKKLAIAVDPDWARRRYEAGVRERDVVGRVNDDGTANVSGVILPQADARSAVEHVEALARAAKRAGHPGSVKQLRSAVYSGLLDGTYQALSDEEIVADLLAHADGSDM